MIFISSNTNILLCEDALTVLQVECMLCKDALTVSPWPLVSPVYLQQQAEDVLRVQDWTVTVQTAELPDESRARRQPNPTSTARLHSVQHASGIGCLGHGSGAIQESGQASQQLSGDGKQLYIMLCHYWTSFWKQIENLSQLMLFHPLWITSLCARYNFMYILWYVTNIPWFWYVLMY